MIVSNHALHRIEKYQWCIFPNKENIDEIILYTHSSISTVEYMIVKVGEKV